MEIEREEEREASSSSQKTYPSKKEWPAIRPPIQGRSKVLGDDDEQDDVSVPGPSSKTGRYLKQKRDEDVRSMLNKKFNEL